MEGFSTLRISTYNIQNICCEYYKRKPALKETLLEINADIFGLQEVSFLTYNQLPDIFSENYKFFFAATQLNFKKVHNIEGEFNIDGSVIAVKKHLLGTLFEENVDEENLHLSPERVVNIISLTVRGSGEKIVFVNVHLHSIKDAPCHDAIRSHQIFFLRKIIEQKFEKEKGLAFWFGDFNLYPFDFTYFQILENNFHSVFKELKGSEPNRTWPSSGIPPEDDPDIPGCIDYIFVRCFQSQLRIEAINCGISGDKPIDGSLYPSDHYALFADFKLSFN